MREPLQAQEGLLVVVQEDERRVGVVGWYLAGSEGPL